MEGNHPDKETHSSDGRDGLQAAIRDGLLADIREGFQQLNDVVSAFSEDQFHLVPFEGSWTPAQVTEHIIKFAAGIPDSHTRETQRRYDEQVAPITQLFLNFSIKMNAPGFVQPGNPTRDKIAVLRTLKSGQERLEDRVKTADLTVTCLDIELPVFGYLTRYEWAKFIVVHMQRHTRQLKNMINIFLAGDN